MGLNGLAKTINILDGQLEATFLPYETLRTRIAYQKVNSEFLSEDWRRGYVSVVSCLLDLKPLTETLDFRAASLMHWWREREDDFLVAFNLFQDVVAEQALIALANAYTETRAKLPMADPILHEGMPDEELEPESLRAGGKRSKRRSSR